MAVTDTIRLIAPFIEQDDGPLLLSSLFAVPPGGIHNSKVVEFHVQRTSRKISMPQRDPTTGYRMNSLKGFDIKKITPAVYKEGLAVSADEIMEGRSIGKTPYDEPTILERIQTTVEPTVTELMAMIKRAIELQASQILQTATVSLEDENGVVFTEDFEALATHFPNASVAWSTSETAVPFTDIANACDVIETDGKKKVRRCFCNSVCFDDMKNTTQFKNGASSQYTGEIYRLDQTSEPVYPKLANGAIFQGVLKIRGGRRIDLYTYDEWYEDPSTGNATKYLGDAKFVLEAEPRLDATFGKLNKFGLDQEAARLLRTGRYADPGKLADLSYNMWFSADYEVFNFGTGTRVALAPITRDRFGCITTKGF